MADARTFADLTFEHVGQIEPHRDADGVICLYRPQSGYKDAAVTPLHAYGVGPFCKFRIARNRKEPGLYVLTVDGVPVYAGECVNLSKRWGPNGYGGISPRNCFKGGQPTNCRINSAILREVQAGKSVDLWFNLFDGSRDTRLSYETSLIQALIPSWNRTKLTATIQ